jgi:glycosyltransferase involved in cell wall biosynthesis
LSDTLITIGITCYREGDWLRECWESVLAQTDDRWVAVLVMDGGADDKTREVFASLEHPKIVKKFAFEQNVGPYPVRNKAFELTDTPYHFYLDGDDMLPPGCIAAMYRTIEAHPDAAYVYGDFVRHPSGVEMRNPSSVSLPDDILTLFSGCGLYSVESWRQLGGFVDFLGVADVDMRISQFEANHEMYNCGELFYVYRTGNENSAFSLMKRTFADKLLAITARHPVFFTDMAFRGRFLARGFGCSVNSNLASGNRVAGVRYALKAMRHLGVRRDDVWEWLFRSITGARPYGKWLGRFHYHIIRRLGGVVPGWQGA